MVKKTLIFILLSCAVVEAHVTVLSPVKSSCNLLLLQKSVQGMLINLEGDPTEDPPENLSTEDYTFEAAQGVDAVRQAYRDLFAEKKRRLEKAGRKISEQEEQEFAALLVELEAEDKVRMQINEGQSGIENTVYLLWKTKAGAIRGVLRATYVKKGEHRQLPMESHMQLPDENRIELQRFYNIQGPYSAIVAREMLMVLAKFSKKYFGSNNYKVHLLTDAARARHYQSHYGMHYRIEPGLSDVQKYYCFLSGEESYDRYVGHIDRAYELAFVKGDRMGGIKLLVEYESRLGMKDYIPNLVAQSVIFAQARFYHIAVEISDHLKTIGSAPINDDYYVLWKSRIEYDPLNNQGDPQKALSILQDYLDSFRLKLTAYNDRALLILIYQLKIYLGSADWASAEALIRANKALLLEGRRENRRNYMLQFAWLGLPRSWKVSDGVQKYQQLKQTLEWMLDLSTHRDSFATSVLHPEDWQQLADLNKFVDNNTLVTRYSKIAEFLKAQGL